MRRFAVLVSLILVAGCSSDSKPTAQTLQATDRTTAVASTASEPSNTAPTTSSTASTAASTTIAPSPATFTVRPGVEQFAILDARPGEAIYLREASGQKTDVETVDEQGSLLFRRLAPGNYVAVAGDRSESSSGKVLGRNDHPAQTYFDTQKIEPGFGYITTRDGTTLSANVVLPGPIDKGPYPTVLEYSGYTPSDPDNSTFAQLYTAAGFAYVGVNIRGTGCSGGSFRFFEYTQSTDGYDAIEAVAAQPWVKNNVVGMVGISYPGISQLFVAQTQPPHLAAITPLSVLDDSIRATLYPGGMLNTGFAVAWTKDRVDQAKPRGQEWAAKRIDGGDKECERNQALRLQNPDLLAEISATPYYTAEVGDDINPSLFVDKINVPVFLAGAWQDEQTGGHFANFLDKFTGTDKLFATMVNGLHTESLISTQIFTAYGEFLDLYVARRAPTGATSLAGPILTQTITGVASNPPATELAGLTYDEAVRRFEARPRVRILFEEGAADDQPAQSAVARFDAGFSAWPIPGTKPTTLYLNPQGVAGDSASDGDTSVTYRSDPSATPETFSSAGVADIWKASMKYDWVPNPVGTAADWTSEPFAADTVMVGTASADLWVESTAVDTDLEVTLSEIRPDGTEMYIQSGWLRASFRAFDETASTPLRPVRGYTEAEQADLKAGEFSLARVEIFPFAHAIRAGSSLRITVDAPGGNRAQWVMKSISKGETNSIGTGGAIQSVIVLPVVEGVDVPSGVPACGSLRGQPCRPVPE